MTVIQAPTLLLKLGATTQLLGSWYPRNAAANQIIEVVQNEYAISGNGAYINYLYRNTVASWGGETLVSSSSGNNVGGVEPTKQFLFNANDIPVGQFFAFAWNSNTSGEFGFALSVYDDVGLYGGSSFPGCCHDPMLDLILAAVRRDFPATT